MLKKPLFYICFLTAPLLVSAEDTKVSGYTAREKVEFTASSRRAFDRSGNPVVHHTLPDGSLMTKHHGSIGNITVARRGPDGIIETFCTTDAEAARAWMAGEDLAYGLNALNLDNEVQ